MRDNIDAASHVDHEAITAGGRAIVYYDKRDQPHPLVPIPCPECGCNTYEDEEAELVWEPGSAFGPGCTDTTCDCHLNPYVWGEIRSIELLEPGEAICWQCGFIGQSSDKFCKECGVRQTAGVCTNCSAKFERYAKFCPECGTPTARGDR